MESKLNFETGSAHTNVMKAVLSSLPGTIKATLLGNKIRLDLVFWVRANVYNCIEISFKK